MTIKEVILNYCAEKLNLEKGQELSMESIIDLIADEFPDIIIFMAQENYINGYNQALDDYEKVYEDLENKDVKN